MATRAVTWSAHVEDRWASTAVADVQTSDVKAWVQDTKAAGAGPATIENALSVLRQVPELAVVDRRLARNPCAGVKAPRRQHRSRGYLTHDQVELLVRRDERNASAVRFLAYTGLRWGEMAALRVEAVDMLRRRVHVHHAVAEVGGKVVWSTPKSHERRSVPFPRFLVDELAALMRGKGRDELVFTAPAGGVLRVSTWRPRVLAPAVVALSAATDLHREKEVAVCGSAITPEFPLVTPHDLRHTAAPLAISAGRTRRLCRRCSGTRPRC
ncbi:MULTISPECIES: tyrosine-type recombinase/integrase [unclassified Mycobacterium]|uniref:tyrosine-type recombinase/integrase n=1 Tax=unclassified Mycobacterium TaxID=2642494 RepID=UPI0029C8AF37|nr:MULTISPECIES: tyrosine-type recombinase/integrase [unclassified Mycobacterium]